MKNDPTPTTVRTRKNIWIFLYLVNINKKEMGMLATPAQNIAQLPAILIAWNWARVTDPIVKIGLDESHPNLAGTPREMAVK